MWTLYYSESKSVDPLLFLTVLYQIIHNTFQRVKKKAKEAIDFDYHSVNIYQWKFMRWPLCHTRTGYQVYLLSCEAHLRS